MKRCPHCAEEIQDAAVACKHCGKAVGAVLMVQQIMAVVFLSVAVLVVWFVVVAYW